MNGPLKAFLAALTLGLLAPMQPSVAHAQASTTAPATSLDQRLIDAAGHFETLTERAYTKSASELSSILSRGEQAVSGVAPELSADARTAVDSAVSKLKSTIATGTPSAVAIASIDVYRTLVNEVSSAHPIPKQVSLLDYAGFKYGALIKADKVDWAEIGKVLTFADGTWAAISASVKDAKLRDDFSNTLAAMRVAAQAQDKAAAETAIQRELALVDDLEKFFAAK